MMPLAAVYIGQSVSRAGYRLPETKWANPFREGRDETRVEIVAKYRAWVCDQPNLMAALPELRGFDLVCWCWPAACHGDVLIRPPDRIDFQIEEV
jgi:hypothetical protein